MEMASVVDGGDARGFKKVASSCSQVFFRAAHHPIMAHLFRKQGCDSAHMDGFRLVQVASRNTYQSAHKYRFKVSGPIEKALSKVNAPFAMITAFRICFQNFSLYVRGLEPDSWDTIMYKYGVNLDRLFRAATPSESLHSGEALLDKAVCDAIEIPADRLMTSDKLPPLKLENFFPYPVKSELCKLVAYPVGDNFTVHRDPVHKTNHIATAILTLPSRAEGGSFVVEHGGQSMTFDGTNQCLVYFADCVHWVELVTKGCKVALIFNIFTKAKNETSPYP